MASAILITVVTIAVVSLSSAQDAVSEGELFGRVLRRGAQALDRIVRVARTAQTTDADFLLSRPLTGIDSHELRFRVVESTDVTTGEPIYEPDRVYIYGPDAGSPANVGIILGRGSDLDTIHAAAAGADGELGTEDDVATALSASGREQAVEVLVSSRFAPRSGDMFTVTADPPPIGAKLEFTLRLNSRRTDGSWVFENDIVLAERVTLWE